MDTFVWIEPEMRMSTATPEPAPPPYLTIAEVLPGKAASPLTAPGDESLRNAPAKAGARRGA